MTSSRFRPSGTPDPDATPAQILGLDHPNVARMYDYFLGGAHNFQLDRDTADAILAVAPEVALAARANRRFLHRAVRYALDRGIRQFLDLGSGIPTSGNVHEIAGQHDPSARVVYVDADPIAVTHATTLLTDVPTAAAIEADLRDTEAVLGHAETQRLIDVTQPVAILAVSVLHFVPGDVATPIAAYRAAMSPGSLLVISHASPAPATEQTNQVQHLYQRSRTPLQLRTPDEIRDLFTGLDLVPAQPDPGERRRCGEPDDNGLVPVTAWRPDGDPPGSAIERSPFLDRFLAGVGRKPVRAGASR
ncbi:MAG: SAM-dependent methyltransferase [Micromonosporaceae bacterium]|nr:SAM-dependent methyltransferase [Micromonosporaceae bacterium]